MIWYIRAKESKYYFYEWQLEMEPWSLQLKMSSWNSWKQIYLFWIKSNSNLLLPKCVVLTLAMGLIEGGWLNGPFFLSASSTRYWNNLMLHFLLLKSIFIWGYIYLFDLNLFYITLLSNLHASTFILYILKREVCIIKIKMSLL